jgi:hypothetical protein
MTKHRARHASTRGGRRKPRARIPPKWLKDPAKMNAVAHSRCMMVLSVLSGETPVTEAIAQARISRGTYYQLETRALKAMLAALNPLATTSKRPGRDGTSTRIQSLVERVQALEQDKRRMKRLMLLWKKTKKPQTVKESVAATRRCSIPSGRRPSNRIVFMTLPQPDSTPMRAGETRSS